MNPADAFLYLLLKAVIILITVLPERLVYCAAAFLGELFYLFGKKRRAITVDNIKRAFPEKSFSHCRSLALDVYKNLGRNLVEFIRFSNGKLSGKIDIRGADRFANGGLMQMGHFGNWEITGMALASSGRDLYPVGRRIHNKAVDTIIDVLRTVFGGDNIPYRGSIRKVLKKIRNNENICVLFDQRMSSGLPVKFFNRPVWVTHFSSVLHRRTGVEVIPSFSYHEDGRLKVRYEEPADFVSSGDTLRADFINTQNQVNWLEDKIRNRPYEWFWLHDFWKDRWPAVFLDRDGTINVDHGYVSEKEDLEFYPGTFKALRELRRAGYLLIVVTNQSGVARGYYTENDYRKLNSYFLNTLEKEGVIIDRVYHCSHHPDDDCYCRKPNPGMVLNAGEELNIDEAASFVVGDKASDINLGKRLDIKTAMVMTGEGKNQIKDVSPDFVGADLAEVAQIIIDETD
jgi:D-glycero-D-manno-heptose 1,7-bisphosphate phosphatase